MTRSGRSRLEAAVCAPRPRRAKTLRALYPPLIVTLIALVFRGVSFETSSASGGLEHFLELNVSLSIQSTQASKAA